MGSSCVMLLSDCIRAAGGSLEPKRSSVSRVMERAARCLRSRSRSLKTWWLELSLSDEMQYFYIMK